MLLEQLSLNLSEKTAGQYEVISISNSDGQYNICEAYNIGAARSKGEILVFLHEDIVIHTKHWDLLLSGQLKNQEIGLLGQAGATYKSRNISSWIDVPITYYRSNLIQNNLTKGVSDQRIRQNETSNFLSEVVVLDGMFLAMRKEIWEEFPFDEKTFNGFHCYDMDISMSIGSKYKVCVCHSILVEHLSSGSFRYDWYKESVKFHKKWRHQLPKCTENLKGDEVRNIEYQVLFKSIIRHIRINSISCYNIVHLLLKAFYLKPLASMNLRLVWQIFKHCIKAKKYTIVK